MTWSNWVSYANQVLNWFLSVFPQVGTMFFAHPVTGVPFLIGIVVLILRAVILFLGAIANTSSRGQS